MPGVVSGATAPPGAVGVTRSDSDPTGYPITGGVG